MMEKPKFLSYVLLKDGTMLECTAEQKESLMMTLLVSDDMSKQRVKLGGVIFFLDDIESDPEKIFKSRQEAMKLGDKQKDTEHQNMG